jgi:uncharacterized protein (DUF1778 family)
MGHHQTKVTIRLTAEEYFAVEVAAASAGCNVTAYVKKAVLGRPVRQSAELAACAQILAAGSALQRMLVNQSDPHELAHEVRRHCQLAISIVRSALQEADR